MSDEWTDAGGAIEEGKKVLEERVNQLSAQVSSPLREYRRTQQLAQQVELLSGAAK